MPALLHTGDDAHLSTVTTKRALLVASHAMERAFDDVHAGGRIGLDPVRAPGHDGAGTGLLIGCFQRREYFDLEASRYADLAARGHTVIVAFTGSVDSLPAGVTAVSLSPDDALANNWVLAMVKGAFAASLNARDIHELSATEATLEASRLFMSWSTLRRHLALEVARAHVESLADSLPPAVRDLARAHLHASSRLPVSEVEDRLACAADYLLQSVEAGYQHAAALRLELESTKLVAERDQLTGLHNRHFLERYLDSGERPPGLFALLIDVDGLKQVNDRFGHEAGDALLRCIAATLRTNTRPGDVLIRWGGDEFLLLVPHFTEAAGLNYGERLAQAIAGGQVDEPWSHVKPSASIGVSTAQQGHLPMGQLDAALYHVKHSQKGHAALAPDGQTRMVPSTSRDQS